MMSFMDKGLLIFQTVENTQVIGLRAKKQEQELFFIQMVINIVEIGRRIKKMDWGY